MRLRRHFPRAWRHKHASVKALVWAAALYTAQTRLQMARDYLRDRSQRRFKTYSLRTEAGPR